MQKSSEYKKHGLQPQTPNGSINLQYLEAPAGNPSFPISEEIKTTEEFANSNASGTRVTRRILFRVHVIFFALKVCVLLFFAKWAQRYSFSNITDENFEEC